MIGRYGLDIARNAERDYISEHKFGSNLGVVIGSQTIWSEGGLYPWGEFDAGAVTLYLISTSTSDTDNVTIYGLDENWDMQNETITMAGTVAVPTTKAYKRIYRMIYDSGETNVGKVTLRTVSGTGTVVSSILAGDGQTLQSIYTIPRGYTAYLCGATVGVGKGGDALIRLYARENYFEVASFKVKSTVGLYETTVSQNYEVPLRFIQQTDIDFRIVSSANNFTASASFDLILDKI